jgi:hypothetical protein
VPSVWGMTTVKTRGPVRTTLWVVLALTLAGNVATQGMLPVSISLGAVALVCGVLLAVDHYKHRESKQS